MDVVVASVREIFTRLRRRKKESWGCGCGCGWVFNDRVAVTRVDGQHLSMYKTRQCIRTASHSSDLPNSKRAKIVWRGGYDGGLRGDRNKKRGDGSSAGFIVVDARL